MTRTTLVLLPTAVSENLILDAYRTCVLDAKDLANVAASNKTLYDVVRRCAELLCTHPFDGGSAVSRLRMTEENSVQAFLDAIPKSLFVYPAPDCALAVFLNGALGSRGERWVVQLARALSRDDLCRCLCFVAYLARVDLMVVSVGRSAMHYAAAGAGDGVAQELLDTLVEYGGRVYLGDAGHWSPVYYAAKNGRMHMLRALLDAGADVEGGHGVNVYVKILYLILLSYASRIRTPARRGTNNLSARAHPSFERQTPPWSRRCPEAQM